MSGKPVDVAIAGAGLAGLSLALDLARQGRQVLLLERRRAPGGAVLSLPGPDEADNSVHLFLAAFSRCLARLDELGSRALLTEMRPTCRVEVQGRMLTMPLGLGRLGTLVRMAALRHPAGGGLGLLGHLQRLERNPPRSGETAADWLVRVNLPRTTPQGLAGCFWPEWCLSVFNAPLECVDAGLFRRTQRLVFTNPRAHRPLLAAGSLAELWVRPFERALAAAGVRLLTSTALRGVERGAGRVSALLLEGERIATRQLVWAGPPEGLDQVAGLEDLRPALPSRREGRHIVNLRLPCAPGPPLKTLSGWFGRPFQWVFSRGDGWLTLVGSGWTDEQLEGRREIEPQLAGWLAPHGLSFHGSPRWIVQRHATALQSPAYEQTRPQARTSLENVYLCGAWLATGLPLSMESALAGAERTLQAMQFE